MPNADGAVHEPLPIGPSTITCHQPASSPSPSPGRGKYSTARYTVVARTRNQIQGLIRGGSKTVSASLRGPAATDMIRRTRLASGSSLAHAKSATALEAAATATERSMGLGGDMHGGSLKVFVPATCT
jgi:hypothetical protein